MNPETLFHLILIGGIAGFAAYCGSYAFHVWRARNASSGARNGAPSRLGWPVALITGGAFLCLLAYAALHATDRNGLLAADGVYTLRVPEKLEVLELPAGDNVNAGDVIARFHSPEREAQLAALTLKQEVLAAEQRIAQREPLPLDTELVRRHQDLVTERRHLEASRDQLLPARDVVDRERQREGAAKRERLKTLGGDIDRLQNELEQASARQELARAQMARVSKMAVNNAATSDELAVKQAELKVLDKEVVKLTSQLAHARAQKEQVQQDLATLENMTATQAVVLDKDIERLRKRLAGLPAEEKPLKEQLSQELAAAEARRQARLEQLDVELKQCRAEIAGLQGLLTVAAPFPGRVAFREPAPKNASEDAPILVLAPPDAFRLRLRLPASEVPSLRRAGSVVLELENPGVERRFEGRLLTARPLAHDRGHVVAELACVPPPDAARDLGAMKSVPVRLRWRPPLYTAPLFWIGAALAAAGALAAVPALVRRPRAAAQPRPAAAPPQDAAAVAVPLLPETGFAQPVALAAAAAAAAAAAPAPRAWEAPDGAVAHSLETGAVAPMLRLLGIQLREALIRGSVDLSVLASVEWSLDRHHVRAVKALAHALGDDEDVVRPIASINVAAIASPGESLERLLRVLRVIGGPRLRHCIRALEQRAQAYAGQGAAAHGKPPAAAHVAEKNGKPKPNGHGSANGNGHGAVQAAAPLAAAAVAASTASAGEKA